LPIYILKRFSNLNNEFPEFANDLLCNIPANTFIKIVELMDTDYPNNWQALAMKIWPNYRMADIKMKFKGMKDVLERWSTEGGRIGDLIQHLIDLKRMDVLYDLKSYLPEIR
jgi:hypothetical protein